MFTVQTPDEQPWNCPYCLYAPVTYSDLQAHLDQYHSRLPYRCCPEPLCGYVYAIERDLQQHYFVAHTTASTAPSTRSLELPKKLKKLLRSTETFLEAVKTLRENTPMDLSSCEDLSLAGLITHALAAASLFIPRKRRVKRVRTQGSGETLQRAENTEKKGKETLREREKQEKVPIFKGNTPTFLGGSATNPQVLKRKAKN